MSRRGRPAQELIILGYSSPKQLFVQLALDERPTDLREIVRRVQQLEQYDKDNTLSYYADRKLPSPKLGTKVFPNQVRTALASLVERSTAQKTADDRWYMTPRNFTNFMLMGYLANLRTVSREASDLIHGDPEVKALKKHRKNLRHALSCLDRALALKMSPNFQIIEWKKQKHNSLRLRLWGRVDVLSDPIMRYLLAVSERVRR